MPYQIKVNGAVQNVDVDGDTPGRCAAPARCISTASPPGPASPQSTTLPTPRLQQSRQLARARREPRSRRRGSTGRSFNAGTASRDRSCPLRRCWRTTRIQRIPTSTTQCPATFAAAERIRAFDAPFTAPRKWPEQEYDDLRLCKPLAAFRGKLN